jgi:small-conductance mechanosensitive channel
MFTVFGEYAYLVKPLIIFLVTLGLGLLLRSFIFRYLSAIAKQTKTEVDDIIISASKNPSVVWCLMLAVYLILKYSELSAKFINISGKVIFVLAVYSITLAAANIAVGLIKSYSKNKGDTPYMPTFVHTIAKILVCTAGILVALHGLGVSITPILATLGVGGIAVALALQDTLSNLFAGFYIIASKQVSIGDYIKIESGEEGHVSDINWRTTKIRSLSNNIILIPNDKLTKTTITNFHMPDRELSLTVNLGVHYNSDLEKVERTTYEVAKDVMNTVSGGIPDFEPSVRYNNFGDSKIELSVNLRAREFADQYLIKHEFIKRLNTRYKKEGIVMPYPTRTIINDR